MRVLIVTERFYPEDFRINELARDWAGKGHEVSVLTQVPSYPQGRLPEGWRNRPVRGESWKGILIDRTKTVLGYADSLKSKLLNYVSFMMRGSLSALRMPRPDVLFCFNTGPLTSSFPAILAGWLRGIPVVIWTQDLWPDTVYAYGFRRRPLLEWGLNSFVRFVYRRCDLVLVSCRGFADRLSEYTRPETELRYLPNWAQELDMSQPPRDLGESEKLHFTFAGNLGKVQNLDRLLDAWKSLSGELHEHCQLNLVGDGSHRAALEARVAAEGIPAVRFHGRVDPTEMGSVYAASHVLVIALEDSPLFRLTVPSKFQTYLAAGRPILAAVGGEVNRLVEAGKVGLAVEPGDTGAIAAALQRFAELDPAALDTMRRRASRLQQEEFDRERIVQALEQGLQDGVKAYEAAHA